MVNATPPAPSLALYQNICHHIDPVATERGVFVCLVDGIRVHPSIGGSWRHDKTEIVELFDAWIATIWPGAERAAALR